MTTYTRKAQVLLTEEEYKTLEEFAARTKKKFSTLIREAIEKVYVEEKRQAQIKDSIDNLLSLSPTPAPENYQQWEEEYLKLKSGGG